MSSFLRWLRTPKAVVIAMLMVLAAAASSSEGPGRVAPQFLMAVGAAVGIDLLLRRLRRGVSEIPDGAVITGMIAAMVLIAGAPPAAVVIAAAVAVASKYFLGTNQIQLFNPAAFGLLVCLVLLPTGQSWWGALTDLPWPAVAPLIVGALVAANRVRRLPMLLAFLGIYFAIFLLLAVPLSDSVPRIAEIFRIPFLNAAIFFSGFMLTDPVTSPGRARDQVWFACVAAFGAAAVFMVVAGLWYLLAGLLMANAWWAWKRTLATADRRGERAAWANAGHGN